MVAGAYTPFLSSYFTSIGLSATEIGILLTIQPIAVIIIQPIWARLSDRSKSRRSVLALLSLATAFASLTYYLGTSFVSVFLATAAVAFFFSALLPLCDALVIEGCEHSGVEFARVRMGGTAGYALIVFAAGSLLERNPVVQFAIVAALSVAFAIAVYLLPACSERLECYDSKEEAAVDIGARAQEASGGATIGVFCSREIIYVLAFAFVSQMGLGFSGSFLGRYVIELGYGQDFVGILNAISALSELPILMLASQIVRRFGSMRLLIASCFFMVVRTTLIGIGTIPSMIVGQLMQSVTYMTVYYSCARYVAQHVLPGKQSQGQSVLLMVQSGIAMLVANLAGGSIGDALGMQASFFLTSALVLIGTLIVLSIYLARTKCIRRRSSCSAVDR